MVSSFENIATSLNSHYTVFIASASYEERCLTITNKIIDKIDFDKRFVSLSKPHKEVIQNSLSQFIEYGFTCIEIDNRNQIGSVNNILEGLSNIILADPNASFLIDISTFTRQTLLILLRIFRNTLTSNNTIQLIYTPAKEYAVGLPESEKWLTQGILEVSSVFGYSGVIRPSSPYHLIILMGYEVERAASLINEYEPSKISIGYAQELNSINDEHYKLNKERFYELLSEFPSAEEFEFSCVSIEDCKNDIIKQVEKYSKYNVVISPMNNKISTISCALAAFDDEKIQLAIAIPAVYNTKGYSAPGDNFYLFDLPNFIKH